MTVPVILTPVTYKNHKLVDVGLVNPTPVYVVKSQNVDKIIAVNLINIAPIKPVSNGYIEAKDSREDLSKLSLNEKLDYFIKHPIDFFSDRSILKAKENPNFGKR